MNRSFRSLPPTAAPGSRDDFAAVLTASHDAPEKLATALAGYLGVWSCYPMASGRAALALLLSTLRQEMGSERDEVIMPAYTCPALAQVTLDAGLRPRPVDVIPETLAMDDGGLLLAASGRTLAIIHVHPFGLPLEMETAEEAARETGAVLIEDAAQAMGARLRAHDANSRSSARAGAAADFGLFSFGPGKPLSTGGGGALAANDPERAMRLEGAWRQMPEGSNPEALARFLASQAALSPAGWPLASRLGARRFGSSEVGQRYRIARMPSLAASIALRALPRLDAVNTRRREVAQAYLAMLQDLDFLDLPQPAAESTPIYLRLPVIFKDGAARDEAYEMLTAAGLGAGMMYPRPLAEHFPTLGGPFPGADALAARLLTLPTHAYVREEDISRIVEL